jgi:hypothetical protein
MSTSTGTVPVLSLRLLAIALAAIATGPAMSARQQPARDVSQTAPVPTGAGVIGGATVAQDGGRAIRRARVTISGGDQRVVRTIVSDDQGTFTFTGLGPGDYVLSASKPGYLDAAYGQRQPGSGRPGTAIHLDANQKIERLPLTMAKGAVLTGVVRDEAGEPAFGSQVRAMRYVIRSGERTLQMASSATVDDRGVYRIGVLQPGEYVISVVPRDELSLTEEMMYRIELVAVEASRSGNPALLDEAKSMAATNTMGPAANGLTTKYAPVYYPGTLSASNAMPVVVTIGEERANLDLQLQLVPTAKVSGIVVGVDGSSPATVQIVDLAQPPGFGTRSVRTTPDGRFSLMGVTPGQYQVFARTTPPATAKIAADVISRAGAVGASLAEVKIASAGAGAPTRWGMADLTVDGREVTNLAITLQDTMTLSGTVAFENAASQPDLSRLSMTVTPVGIWPFGEMPMPRMSPVDTQGRFTISGLLPGRYRVVPSSGVPAGFQIKSSVFAGRDSLDFPIDLKSGEDRGGVAVTFTNRVAEISGTLQDQDAKPVADYTVVLFAADQQYWQPGSRRILSLRPSTSGRFTFRPLPAGDYRLVAVTDLDPTQLADPEFLKQLVPASIPLSVAEGEKKAQDIRVKG